jgi:hypothetical protein
MEREMAKVRHLHRWTPEEHDLLARVVEVDLKTFFIQAEEEGRPEIDVWNLVPGKLGIMVSGHACWQQYRGLKNGQALAERNANGPVMIDLEPLLDEMRAVRVELAEMREERSTGTRQVNEKLALMAERYRDTGVVMLAIKEALENSATGTELYLEKISGQFEKLLTELRKI